MTRYVEERRAIFGVEPICRVLEIPVSTFYARRSRVPSHRELADRELIRKIRAAREGYRQAYGVRKTWKELRRRGVDVGRDRVARLMRQEGLEGLRRGRKKRTTIPDEAAVERARDLIQRDFTAAGPDETWVCDLTYLRTWQGFVYLAFILDVYSRMLVGWQLAMHMRTDLVLDALEMANGLRQPEAGLIAHSDRGSQPEFNRLSQHCRFTGWIVAPWSACLICGGWCRAGDRGGGVAAGAIAGAVRLVGRMLLALIFLEPTREAGSTASVRSRMPRRRAGARRAPRRVCASRASCVGAR